MGFSIPEIGQGDSPEVGDIKHAFGLMIHEAQVKPMPFQKGWEK